MEQLDLTASTIDDSSLSVTDSDEIIVINLIATVITVLASIALGVYILYISLNFLVTHFSAPVAVCTTGGLFSTITNFVSRLFAILTFNELRRGTLSNVSCQGVGFFTMYMVFGFLGVLGYVGYQIGYHRQPISMVLDPLIGFFIFAGGATTVICILLS